MIHARIRTEAIDKYLFDEIMKISGPKSKKIVERYCLNKMDKKSLDWLIRNAD